MNEITRKFVDVLSEKQRDDLLHQCNYCEDDVYNEFYFNSNDFINGYSIIEYGYGKDDFRYGEHNFNIIDTNGHFVEIKLNNEIKYINGDISKLNGADKGSYSFSVHRVKELVYQYDPHIKRVVESTKDTAYFYIKVHRHYSYKDSIDLYFVIDSELKVIATFTDANKYGIEYDGYKNCDVYTERRFFFINEERRFLVFTQKLIADNDESGFFEEHMYGLDSDLYDDYMQDLGFYDDSSQDYTIYEYQLDEKTLNKVIEKYTNSLLNNNKNEENEDDETPALMDITFFYDDKNNILYKKVFSDYYRELFGIIDCRIPANEQLIPFTDNINYVINIIHDRWRCEKECDEKGNYRGMSYGWEPGYNHFYGYVMSDKFFDYPYMVKGYTLKYVLKFYPEVLKKLVDNDFVLIPNKLLDSLENNELTRHIRIKQETHLEYSTIDSIDDVIKSDNKYDLISSYQGKTLKQVIYTKGGTKHLVNLLKYTNFKISKEVVTELINTSNNQFENNCYNIILKVIEDKEYQKELYNDYIREKEEQEAEDYMIREINRQFKDMMDDFDAWENID